MALILNNWRYHTDGIPEEHFLKIVYLKKANPENIYFDLVECLKEKQPEVSRIIGMSFDVYSFERKLESRQGLRR